jgi:hypothetical protein
MNPALKMGSPPTFADILDFVSDIQDKQETEFFKAGNDISDLKSIDVENYVLSSYNHDYYTPDPSLSLGA